MPTSSRPELGSFVVYACAICDRTGLATMNRELVPEGPSIFLCEDCTENLHAHPGDLLMYCMDCRRVTHVVKPGDAVVGEHRLEDGDRIVFVRDCRVPHTVAYKRSELHDLGFTGLHDGNATERSPI